MNLLIRVPGKYPVLNTEYAATGKYLQKHAEYLLNLVKFIRIVITYLYCVDLFRRKIKSQELFVY